MKELIGKVVFVEFYGEGYYSGSSSSQSAFISKEFFDKHVELFEGYTPYFSELDGKHSEIQGEMKINNCSTEAELINALRTSTEKDDDYMIWSDILYDVDGALEEQKMSNDIMNKVQIKTVVTITYDGVVI